MKYIESYEDALKDVQFDPFSMGVYLNGQVKNKEEFFTYEGGNFCDYQGPDKYSLKKGEKYLNTGFFNEKMPVFIAKKFDKKKTFTMPGTFWDTDGKTVMMRFLTFNKGLNPKFRPTMQDIVSYDYAFIPFKVILEEMERVNGRFYQFSFYNFDLVTLPNTGFWHIVKMHGKEIDEKTLKELRLL